MVLLYFVSLDFINHEPYLFLECIRRKVQLPWARWLSFSLFSKKMCTWKQIYEEKIRGKTRTLFTSQIHDYNQNQWNRNSHVLCDLGIHSNVINPENRHNARTNKGRLLWRQYCTANHEANNTTKVIIFPPKDNVNLTKKFKSLQEMVLLLLLLLPS